MNRLNLKRRILIGVDDKQIEFKEKDSNRSRYDKKHKLKQQSIYELKGLSRYKNKGLIKSNKTREYNIYYKEIR